MILLVKALLMFNLLLALLMLMKCFYQESVCLDRKALLLISAIAGFYLVRQSVSGSFYIEFGIQIVQLLLLVYCILRGKEGRIGRIFSALAVLGWLTIGIISFLELCMQLLYPELRMIEFTEKISYLYCGTLIVINEYLYFSIFRPGMFLKFGLIERVFIVFSSILIFSILVLIQNPEELKTFAALSMTIRASIAGLLFCVYIAVYLVMIIHKRSSFYRKQQEIYNDWMEQELLHFHEYKNRQEELRKFRHDLLNNISCISIMVQEGKLSEAKEYIDNMSGKVQSFSPKVVTGDDMLDCIIASKWKRMMDNGISFVLDGVLDGKLNWNPMDLCSVFANAVDNAIEASIRAGEHTRITMVIKNTRNYHCIEIRNQIKEGLSLEEVGAEGYTTKKDRKLHGYGLENMRRTLKKYDGDMSIDGIGQFFLLTIMIPNS